MSDGEVKKIGSDGGIVLVASPVDRVVRFAFGTSVLLILCIIFCLLCPFDLNSVLTKHIYIRFPNLSFKTKHIKINYSL